MTRLQFDICYLINTRARFEVAVHFLFKLVINLKMLILRSTSIVKLFVHKTVKYEVINVEFPSRDLPLNNSASMVKWKCMKLLYSSKGMCRIDSQIKNWYIRNIYFLKTPYTFFSIFSRYFIVLHTLSFLSPLFSGIKNKNFSFFGFSNVSFLCLFLEL